MWDLLRSSLLHYLRHDEFTDAVRKTADVNLQKYSALAQEVRSRGALNCRVCAEVACNTAVHFFSVDWRMTASFVLCALIQLLPDKMLTFNLHMINCRLYDQETARCDGASLSQLWHGSGGQA